MKTGDRPYFVKAFDQLLRGSLVSAERIHVLPPAQPSGALTHTWHSHDAWEMFCPLQGSLKFLRAGHTLRSIPPRHVLLVPPGCLHVAVEFVAQSPRLQFLVLTFPGNEFPYGELSVSHSVQRRATAMSAPDLVAWTALVGAAPANVLEQMIPALAGGRFAKDRALGLFRNLLAGCAEVVTERTRAPQSTQAQCVTHAQLFLQSHYPDPTLTVARVAQGVGAAVSHFGVLFRETTGRTINQTLTEIRLQRATDLLAQSAYSIKEISLLTGWSNQLYFSAAYRRRYGYPPSAVRQVKAAN